MHVGIPGHFFSLEIFLGKGPYAYANLNQGQKGVQMHSQTKQQKNVKMQVWVLCLRVDAQLGLVGLLVPTLPTPRKLGQPHWVAGCPL